MLSGGYLRRRHFNTAAAGRSGAYPGRRIRRLDRIRTADWENHVTDANRPVVPRPSAIGMLETHRQRHPRRGELWSKVVYG